MKVYELMTLLQDCPAGDEVHVGGYMTFAELAAVEDKDIDKGSWFDCRKAAEDVSSNDNGITRISF